MSRRSASLFRKRAHPVNVIFVLTMSLQAGEERPDVTEVGAPPESIPQKVEPVIHSTDVGSKARLVTLDVARSSQEGKG
jgi:hypothetical protein